MKVVFADKAKVVRQLKDYVKRIKRTHPEIERMKEDGNAWIRHIVKEAVWL